MSQNAGEVIMSPECRACTQLGLDPFTDYRSEQGWQMVVEAHRSIVKRWHPDRFIDGSPEEQQDAIDRTVEANGAYNLLRAARRREPRWF